jgi:hypothetical protein
MSEIIHIHNSETRHTSLILLFLPIVVFISAIFIYLSVYKKDNGAVTTSNEEKHFAQTEISPDVLGTQDK